MDAIRRLYVYAVAFISLEVVLWGSIELARSAAGRQSGDGSARQLAGALSLILVGLPVFWLHWGIAQRNALADLGERSSRLRAIFLYGVLLATLLPAVQNGLALVNRFLLDSFELEAWRALVGGEQVAVDNLIAIALNAAVAFYFFQVLKKDWQQPLEGEAFAEVGRLFRYIWLLYGVGLLVAGVQQVVHYLLVNLPGDGEWVRQPALWNGVSLALVGTGVYIFSAFWIEQTLALPSERQSLTRLVVLYGLVFTGVAVLLASAGLIGETALRWLFGENMTPRVLLAQVSRPISLALPFGMLWMVSGSTLSRELSAMPDSPRRSALRRLYAYVLSLFGLGATFIGLQMLLFLGVDLILGSEPFQAEPHERLSSALAFLLVGLPLWLSTWRPMEQEARQSGESGDHARRSLVRKTYLYLALFSGVMGVMFSSGTLLFTLLRTALGDQLERLAHEITHLGGLLMLFTMLLGYHWWTLSKDARLAARTLAKRHAQFPVLVLAPENGNFTRPVVAALRRQAPSLPVAVHSISQGAPDETLSAARAVIIPSEVLARPTESLRLWLQTFPGTRLVLPTPTPDWNWIVGTTRSSASLASQAASTVRQLAEGENGKSWGGTASWQMVVYVLAGLFVLQSVLMLIGMLASLVFGQ
jgi:hypothetical protein